MFALPGSASRFTVIDLSSDQLNAVHLSVSRGGVTVGARVCTDIPPDIEPSDEQWLGKWIARTLEEHCFGRGPAVFIVPRQSVGLKHLVLPSTRIDELPGMVAIKVAGQLPFPAKGSTIDYAVLSQQQGQSEVMAAAVRHELVERYRALARAGGFRIDRIALRPLATGALVADLSRERSGSLLAIDLRRYGEVELVVACDGKVRFARAAEVIAASEKVDRHEEARRLATEAKRSWMSYRATEASPDVEHIVVIGTDGLAGGVATEVRSALGRPTEVLLSHPKVHGETSTLGSNWPLVGVGLEMVESLDGVNFDKPKEAPDVAAHRRQRLLAGVAAAVIVLGTSWTAGNMHLRRLAADLERLEAQASDIAPDYFRFEHERLRLEHLHQWETAHFDWLEHLAFVAGHLPATEQAILGSFGAWMGNPVFRWKEQKWLAPPMEASIQFSGAAVSRPIADAIRAAFVDVDAYTAQPIVADTSSNDKTYTDAFGLKLITTLPTPFPQRENPQVRGANPSPAVAEASDAVPAATEGATGAGESPTAGHVPDEPKPASGEPPPPPQRDGGEGR